MPAAAGPAALAALKGRSTLMAGDMDLASTAAGGQAQRVATQTGAAAAAQAPGAAAQAPQRARDAYDMRAMQIASRTMPVQPAARSSAGRPVAPIFLPSSSRGGGRAGASRGASRIPRAAAGRGRGRGRPVKAGGQYICERCGTGLASKDNLARHYAKYEITTPNGTMEERKLCVIEDAELIKQLKAKHLAPQPGQTQLQLTPAAHPAHPAPTTSTAAVPTATVAAGTVASIPVASEDDPDHEAAAVDDDDQFAFAPEEGSYIAMRAQERFWRENTLDHLPVRARRKDERGKWRHYTKGKWRLNSRLRCQKFTMSTIHDKFMV